MTYMTNDDLKIARNLHAQALCELDSYQALVNSEDDEGGADRALQAAIAYALAAQTAIRLGSPR